MQQGLGTMLDTPSADTPRRVHDGRQHWGEHRAYHAGTDAICGKYADAASLLPDFHRQATTSLRTARFRCYVTASPPVLLGARISGLIARRICLVVLCAVVGGYVLFGREATVFGGPFA